MIRRLRLTDFRNHAEASLDVGDGFVLLSGPNGAGKTNILEAVSLLAPGRGLRGASLAEMARSDGSGGFGIAARLADDTDLATGTLATAPERRQVRINGASSAVNSLGERLAILWLTPAMDRLFSDSAGGRRRFLDRLVLALEPGHAGHAARYEAAMRARNKLLAEPQSADPEWLTALESGMAEHGTALADARKRTVGALSARLGNQDEREFPAAILKLEGEMDVPIADVLRRNRGRDAAAGRTLEGPHRHDLLVLHKAKAQPASRSSTGEQKALLMTLVLAHAELVTERRDQTPILLLDEIAAHLDPERRAALYRRLEGRGQVWMTGTEAELFNGIRGTRLVVRNGLFRTD